MKNVRSTERKKGLGFWDLRDDVLLFSGSIERAVGDVIEESKSRLVETRVSLQGQSHHFDGSDIF